VSAVYSSAGSIYSNQFTATGGVQPYVWTVSSGTLPAGLSLSTGGLLTGTPSGAVSARSITYEVTDANSTTATVTLPITVAATVLSITVGTCTLTGTQYTTYGGCQLNAVGGTSPYSFPNNANHNPEGFEINSSGTISGTLYGMGGYGVVFLVTDSLGTTAAAPGYTYFSIAGNSTTAGCLPWAGTIFNYDISSLPVDTSVAAPISSAYTSSPLQVYGGSTPDDGFNGIPFMTVPYNQALVAIPGGLYFSNGPWPWYATVEFSSDHHSILVQTPGGGN